MSCDRLERYLTIIVPMKKLLMAVGFIIFVAGCDQSMLAPPQAPESPKIVHEPSSDTERSENFAKAYGGSSATVCYKMYPGGMRLHLKFKDNRAISDVDRYENTTCKNHNETKSRRFTFKIIDVWKYETEKDYHYTIHVVFDESSNGEISQYDSVITQYGTSFFESGHNIKIMQDGNEVPQDGFVGGMQYFRDETSQ
jgi:hypothetical protein